MLARNNKGVLATPGEETEICRWTSDGVKYLVGFSGTGQWSAEFRLYVGADEDPFYVGQVSSSNRNAYVADRGGKVPAGTVVRLVVELDETATDPQMMKGTILGS